MLLAKTIIIMFVILKLLTFHICNSYITFMTKIDNSYSLVDDSSDVMYRYAPL